MLNINIKGLYMQQ